MFFDKEFRLNMRAALIAQLKIHIENGVYMTSIPDALWEIDDSGELTHVSILGAMCLVLEESPALFTVHYASEAKVRCELPNAHTARAPHSARVAFLDRDLCIDIGLEFETLKSHITVLANLFGISHDELRLLLCIEDNVKDARCAQYLLKLMQAIFTQFKEPASDLTLADIDTIRGE